MKNEDLELMEKMQKLPSWIIENEDGTYTVKTKDGDFIMEEQSGEVIDKVNRLSEKTNVDVDSLLVTRSLIEPKLSDEDLKKLKGSSYMRLKAAIAYVYDMTDFF
jgi:hypothetical protein